MLQALRVTDYVLFGRVDIEFGAHLNVITGETGAGKSILLGAVELLLGGEASSEMIRAGAERAVVEGLFTVSQDRLTQLRQAGLLDEESGAEIILRREISSSGRSRCFINGALANLTMLRRLGEELIRIHGQQKHQLLVKPSHQLDLLDAFGGLMPQRKEFASLLSRYKACAKKLSELEKSLEQRNKERELAAFQRDEIDRACVSLEEEKKLEEELRLLENAEQIKETASALLAGLEGDEGAFYAGGAGNISVLDTLGSMRRQLENLCRLSGESGGLLAQFDEARYTLQELVTSLRNLLHGIDHDPARLEQLRARREELYKLKKKYGPHLEDVLAYRDKLAARLEQAEKQESDLEVLRDEKRALEQRLKEASRSLSAARKAAAGKLEKELSERLGALAMTGGKFRISVEPAGEKDSPEQYLTSGADRITFLLSTNPGVPLMPLSSVASGGELSRIMLALESAMVQVETPSTMIFDEVDSGIGGKVGRVVGEYLSEIAAKNQVLVITHLAQIARYADTHLVVEKFSSRGRTETRVRKLSTDELPQEIARMLAGDTESETSLAHARQMLERTQKERP